MADFAARAPGAVILKASAGDVLFRVDDVCHGFIALRSGSLRVGLTSAAGRELVLYRVRPGEICLQTFSCLARHGAYAAEGIAETDLDAVLIPPTAFDRLMSEDQAFRSVVLSSVASRFMDLEAMVETLAFTGLPARLAGALLRNAQSAVVRMTHEDLAAEIGSAREAVSRQLAVFARADLVSLRRGRITLDNISGLERVREVRA
jgi:CRP/FNR family transcriptional regulator